MRKVLKCSMIFFPEVSPDVYFPGHAVFIFLTTVLSHNTPVLLQFMVLSHAVNTQTQ